ncbi:MAG TPA: DnaJ family domain-containing protein [Ktedonobacteraceae bacterium]|jgi:DnaJ family protein C protein 28|nr:DnaJ family domain-containing protein [Ktedonobacteraceae bacterium]
MDFKDWRKTPQNTGQQSEEAKKYLRRLYRYRVEEQIREAQERGEFDNLRGAGKPLNLEEEHLAGEKTLAYRLLKSNDYAPPEIELQKEIRREIERQEKKLARVRAAGESLRTRRVPPFASEKQAYNDCVEKAAREYDEKLRELNRKILTLNLSVPSAMHMPFFEVEKLVQQFRETCRLF